MDHPTTSTLLTWMTFMPLSGAALILAVLGLRSAGAVTREMGDQISRVIALAASGIVLVQGFFLWRAFDPSNPALQFVQHGRWIPAYNIEYFVGVDGISITLVMLTALVSFIATIASMPWWPGNAHLDDHHFTQHGVPGYMAMLLLLQTGMIGVFVSMDMFLFYVFWEVMLLPMYFLIGIWGGPRREYAAIKFFLYTMLGSVFILIAMLGTQFEPQTEGKLLFLEDVGTKPYQLDRMLWQLKQAEKLDGVKGIIFGEMLDCTSPGARPDLLEDVILNALDDFEGPIAIGLRSGHVSRANVTLTFGVEAELTHSVEPELRILEAAVAR